MGAIGGLFGLSGGASGTGFDAPQQAGIETQQGAPLGIAAGESYYRNQAALDSQNRLLSALNEQRALQKQTDVYGQLQDIAAGKGPNPAQAMLNQATGANVANQAALMAGQRGSGANVGLMARQIAGQGANIQQQAAGQGAVMQANQSMGAIDRAGNLANTMAANQMAGQNAVTNAEQAQYGNLLNALAQQNQAKIGSQSSVNAGNVNLAQTGMGGQQKVIGGIFQSAGAGAKMAAGAPPTAAHGGMISGYADGGTVGAQSSLGKFLTTVRDPGAMSIAAPSQAPTAGAAELERGVSDLGQGIGSAIKPAISPAMAPMGSAANPGPMATGATYSSGGQVDVVLSPGEKVIPPGKVNAAAGGKVEAKTVPGKAKVSGDSVKNDTYQTKLPEGSIVVPRTKSGDNKDAAAFVRKVLAQRGRGK